MLNALASGEQLGDGQLSDQALALEILVGDVLPVLLHAAAAFMASSEVDAGNCDSQQQASPVPAGSHQHPSQSALPASGGSSSPAVAAVAAHASTSSSSVHEGRTCTALSSQPASRTSSTGEGDQEALVPVPMPDSTLMLLAASSQVLRFSALTMYLVAIPSIGIAGTQSGNAVDQTAGPLPDDGQESTVAAFHCCLYLAHSLVSGGPWWREAKAKYPLLLIEAVLKTATVSHDSVAHGLHLSSMILESSASAQATR
jgi:hypothetical protein